MKTWILAMTMMAGLTMSAQKHHRTHDDERGPKKEHHNPFTPEQRAELRTKQLTLTLDLTDKQATELQKLFLTNAQQIKKAHEERIASPDAGKKPTADERFAMQTKRLDAQIAAKREMKKILTADQYEKFEKMKHDRKQKFTKKPKKLKKQHHR